MDVVHRRHSPRAQVGAEVPCSGQRRSPGLCRDKLDRPQYSLHAAGSSSTQMQHRGHDIVSVGCACLYVALHPCAWVGEGVSAAVSVCVNSAWLVPTAVAEPARSLLCFLWGCSLHADAWAMGCLPCAALGALALCSSAAGSGRAGMNGRARVGVGLGPAHPRPSLSAFLFLAWCVKLLARAAGKG